VKQINNIIAYYYINKKYTKMINSKIKQHYKEKNKCNPCDNSDYSSSSSYNTDCTSNTSYTSNTDCSSNASYTSNTDCSSNTSCTSNTDCSSNNDIKIINNTPIYDNISGNCSNCTNTNDLYSKQTTTVISKNSLKQPFQVDKPYLPVTNKVVIDIAVLCQEYTKIEKMCNDHIINLDEIEITKELFQYIFYPFCDNFGINRNTICNNCTYIPYISFLPEYRSVNGKKFYLLEEIISNIETDLNISRNCFTVESLVELTNEIISISSLCDLNCCSVLASLTWCNILEIVNNYNIINDNCDCSIKPPVIPIFAISVIFKTPTPHVKNTIVRFNYRITDL
jgi:hypothetical protein